MMSDRSLRAADPAADWRVDPQSTRAQQMLTGILATPHDVNADLSRRLPERQRGTTRRVWRRRIAFGGGAALAVTVAMSTLWNGEPNGATAAYAVTAKPDGSVELTVRWEQLRNVGGLATKLRQAGVPTVVTSSRPDRVCAAPADRDRASEALNKQNPNGQPASLDGYVMRPKLFPEGSTLVISTFSDTATQLTYTMFYLAPTGSTSCTLSGTLGSVRYTGPGPHPTRLRITWPEPAE
ncbi:hypothetical protein O7600_22105 [Micromonospora sp. WMMA1998]|uniref:hypothetical protein n=1 Tax=Micromonospora sp. WMMA1998 TaxID=3015167 RepID=UPI00248AE62A|nr:hypothetical protein [Micromonospora sp. WMMA1998]WBC13794.1 hypothetical protein O7600_22105 [Micromonospora sp. WMMA1998]